jgi:hypothetical protein
MALMVLLKNVSLHVAWSAQPVVDLVILIKARPGAHLL